MLHTKTIATSLVLVLAGVTGAQAQSLSDNPTPAELPSAGYASNQYIDSAGCVFIRAGIDGNVTWVPRVSRDRRQICGAQPSIARATPAPAPAPVVAAPESVESAATPTAPAPTPAPKPKRIVQAPKPAPVAVAQPNPRVVSPAPAPVVVAPAAPKTARLTCPNASVFSNRYINDGTHHPVRCGPQALPNRTSEQFAQGVTTGKQRILPAHLLEQRRQASAVRVPEGYDPVWSDDRLNPHRGEQSASGYMESQYSWTNTVPRRMATAAKRPKPIKQPKIVSNRPQSTQGYRPKLVTRTAATQQVAKATAPKRKTAAKAAAAPNIYVQVGLYAVDANAKASAQMMARTGFPTRMGRLKRGGKSYQLVLSGPFASEAEATPALRAARKAGFSDAFLRK